MFSAVILVQILAVSMGSYINFALEEPCPEKFYGSPKCYIYTYKIRNQNNYYSKKRVYIKKPWVSLDEGLEEKEITNHKS